MSRVQDIINSPLQVPAKSWTTVTDDDLISHLMSLWFIWAHPWWHWVDQKQFLKAMQAAFLTDSVHDYLLDTLAEDGTEPDLEL
ncbi:uncharacterized protein A1O5_01590 [Cladophialophora psammophila CBS 110553]|uniref:Uncharacterized protein n=1 Tax=Cladophialophora psammophila CBS 110553 TaxID=1182543 RepID=W9XXB2_9EURO|nr:uncharacterized protein A1O5_01590 [Cladophialophora psammophila CBS 110553]EXJ74894.1 hypothetical protein A1O5_01590 [Cladophialophora psammophila CBS 110553]